MMKLLLLLSLLPFASSTDFAKSMVITSADITDYTQHRYTTLKANSVYRVYATYAAGASADYAKNVLITDDTGASLTVAGLAMPYSGYFLDNLRTLRAPITIQDNNNGAITKVPYTIYVVDASVTSFPVVSARDASGTVDSNSAFVAAGLTVLSAEKMFTMQNFNMYGLSNMVISSVGFDETSDKYNVLKLNSWEASYSFLTMYGPIATLFNTNWGWNARFQFTFTRGAYNSPNSLNYGAATALVSPGYLSSEQSYNIAYTVPEALSASYSWNGNNRMGVQYSARDFQGETLHLEMITSDGQNSIVDIKQDTDNSNWQWANRVSMNVLNSNGVHVPRFRFQVTSGASLSFSLVGILLVSLFSKFH